MGLKMDLHMYSAYSEGSLKPLELVRKFYNDEYSQIALTDRNTTEGVKEAQIAGEALGIQVNAGVEMSAVCEGTPLYILGYYIDVDNEALQEGLRKLRESGEPMDSGEVIALIRGAGGIPALAAPMEICGIGEPGSEDYFQRLDEILRTLKKQGLGAVECFHPSATREQGITFVTCAEKYHLHVTQGSGFKGPETE